MREILFKGKRIVNGEWVHGDLHHGARNIYIMGTQVIPETVGQYTGLRDRNGVGIYEGDVVNNRELIWYSSGKERRFSNAGVVRYDTKSGCLVTNNDDGRTKRLTAKVIKNDHVQVIGNIHDNPELVGKKK